MKLKNIAFAALLSLAFTACKNGEAEKGGSDSTSVAKDSSKPATSEVYNVNLDSSNVKWHGEIVGGAYFHDGLVKLKSAELSLNGESIAAGKFEVDLKSMTPTDKNFDAKQKKTPEGLVSHLSNGDFFLVDSFPTASFVIKSVEGNTLTGDLTVRGKTNEEKVTDVVVSKSDAGVTATGKLVFNRQKYGVSYKSTMKDIVLSDDVTLNISLKATK